MVSNGEINFPPGVVWKKSVIINRERVIICTNIASSRIVPKEFRLNENLIPLLKSNIQKCVRRQIPDKALKSAYQLMNILSIDKTKEIGMTAFLRRLSIISMEDTIVPESLSTVIWFMVAHSKGYILCEKQRRWLLGFLYVLVNSKQFSRMEWKDNGSVKIVYNDFVKSLFIRKMYGGMPGDIKMVESSLYHYSRNKPAFTPIIRMKMNDLSFDKSDIELSSVDFHCYPGIVYQLQERYPDYSKEHIKKIIWDERSGVNVRLPAYAGNYMRNGLFRRLRPSHTEYDELYEDLTRISLRILGNLTF